MKDRIHKIMEKTQMTQQDFAAKLGISPASLSSIFNGRTNPSNNQVQAIHRCFPEININWLMFGEGDMYEPTPGTAPPTSQEASLTPLSDGTLPLNFKEVADLNSSDSPQFRIQNSMPTPPTQRTEAKEVIHETIKYIDKPQRKITEIRVFFDDGTYETFSAQK
jgi:transcriptional regulator with XRE-family HTH domain